MSRVPRAREHLKTGFACEAAAAAKFRAYARAAEREGRANLSKRWLELAHEKDALAIRQLEAAGQVRPAERSIADALAEERYENQVLYPKMIRDVDGEEAAEVFRTVVGKQEKHVASLAELKQRLQGARGDID